MAPEVVPRRLDQAGWHFIPGIDKNIWDGIEDRSTSGRPGGRPLADITYWIGSFDAAIWVAQQVHADARIRVRADIVAAAVIDIERRVA
jgi:hypothetical protein